MGFFFFDEFERFKWEGATADEAPGGLFVCVLACVSTVVYSVLHLLAVSSETVQSVAPSAQSVLLPGLVLLFTALALRAAREQWFNLGFWGFVGFARHWKN